MTTELIQTEASLLARNSCLVLCTLLACFNGSTSAQDSSAVTRAEHYLKQQQTAQELYKSGQFAAYAAHMQRMAEEYPYKSNLLPRMAAA